MEMMRNPNAMREAVRSQDLALSQIENHPEGYNALRRMYEDIQEPMFDAAQAANNPAGANRGTTGPSVPMPIPAAPNASALPNPWGRPAATPAPMGGMPGGFGANPYGGGMGGGMNPYAGMGGMGGGGMPPGVDPAQAMAMMQNPMMQQMMQQMMSDPNFIQQVCIYSISYIFFFLIN